MARRHEYIFAEEPQRRRRFLPGVMIVMVLLLAALFTWNLTMNNTVTYTKEYVTIANLPRELENWTILHLSDLNGADLGKRQSAVRTAIGTRSYSCIVLSGNMVGQTGDVQPMLDLLGILPQGTPVLLLPGDDDPPLYNLTGEGSGAVYADWVAALQAAGVTILDEPIAFQREKRTIWFVPEHLYTLNVEGTLTAYQNQLDTLNAQVEALTPEQEGQRRNALYQVERMQRILEKTAAMKAEDIQVAVSHIPLTREGVAEARLYADERKAFSFGHVSLVLAGGYCAGQWRIPGVGAVYVPELGFFPQDAQITGMGYLGGVWQHISPGLGPAGGYPLMPFRLFNSPGATMIVLTSSVY